MFQNNETAQSACAYVRTLINMDLVDISGKVYIWSESLKYLKTINCGNPVHLLDAYYPKRAWDAITPLTI